MTKYTYIPPDAITDPDILQRIEQQEARLKGAIYGISSEASFYYTLLLHARPKVAYREYKGVPIPTACTDGEQIIFGLEFIETLTLPQVTAVLKHEVMHMALGHVWRGRGRPPRIFNIGADTTINKHLDVSILPGWTVRIPELEELSAEEITSVLLDEARQGKPREVAPHDDLISFPLDALEKCPHCGGTGQEPGGGSPDDGQGGQNGQDGQGKGGQQGQGQGGNSPGQGNGQGQDGNSTGQGGSNGHQHGQGNGHQHGPNGQPCSCCGGSGWRMPTSGDPMKDASDIKAWGENLQASWRHNLQNAIKVGRQKGDLPAGMELLADEVEPHINWRTQLWQYIETARNDYGDLDVRLLNAGIPCEDLEVEHLRAAIGMDTSGSMYHDLTEIVSELKGMKSTYPSVALDLWWIDARADGPYHLEADTPLPPATGGGGTDFRPFFRAVEELAETEERHQLMIYFTDGYGDFPTEEIPGTKTLWIVVAGGLASDQFPFGDVIRIVE